MLLIESTQAFIEKRLASILMQSTNIQPRARSLRRRHCMKLLEDYRQWLSPPSLPTPGTHLCGHGGSQAVANSSFYDKMVENFRERPKLPSLLSSLASKHTETIDPNKIIHTIAQQARHYPPTAVAGLEVALNNGYTATRDKQSLSSVRPDPRTLKFTR